MGGLVIAGIDGGGTRTECLIHAPSPAQGAGRLGWGSGGPLNTNYVTPAQAQKSVLDAVTAAAQMAGVELSQLRHIALAAPWSEQLVAGVICGLAPDATVTAEGEDTTALMGGWLRPHGLVLSAGTGSRCAFVPPGPPASRATGAEHAGGGEAIVTGAWGSLFGDEGSGYDIGARVLRAATRVWDGRGPDTILASMVTAAWDGAMPKDIVGRIYAPPPGAWRSRIAALCPLAGRAAAGGDALAQDILKQAAFGLAEMVGATASRAGLEPPYRIMATGGVISGLGELILEPLRCHLARWGDPEVCLPELPAVAGALLLAARHAAAVWDASQGGVAAALAACRSYYHPVSS